MPSRALTDLILVLHATTAMIIMVAGAIAHGHRSCTLTTTTAFSCATPPHVGAAPHPLPPTDRCIGHWSPRTPTPIRGSCLNRVASVHMPSSSGLQGEEEGGEKEDDECHISVVVGPVGAPTIRRTAHGAHLHRSTGHPQGLLAIRTATMPPTSPTPSLAVPGPSSALPSSKAGPSGFGMPPDLKSLCGNQLLHWFVHLVAPSSKGHVPGSCDSTAGPS
jgi:hypothetical protein